MLFPGVGKIKKFFSCIFRKKCYYNMELKNTFGLCSKESHMNEVITKLYDIEEQAGTILKNAQLHKEQLQQQMQEDKKSLEKELEAGLQNRLADARKQMDEKAREQIEDIKVQYARQIAKLDETYDGSLDALAEEIFERITKV